jgi:iron complex outermembrane receptor protein
MKRGFAAWTSVLALAVSGLAQAQTPAPTSGNDAQADNADELVVTARKREEQIIDVPASVSTLSGDQLEDLGGVTDIRDLSYVAPGLALVDTGNINSEVNIRGAGAGTARVTGVDAPIGVLRNGANIAGGNIGGRTFTRTDLFDVGRVEVVRGPQGALYGVNSVGGVINVVSRRPSFEPGARGAWGYSPDIGRGSLEAIVNIPLGDTFAMRVGGQAFKSKDGHFQNVVTGEAGDLEQYEAGRISLLWAPSPDLSFYSVIDSAADVSSSNRVRTRYELNDPTATPGPVDPDGPFRFGHNTSNEVQRDLLNWTGEIAWNSPFGKVTSITSYRDRGTRFFQDEDGTAPGYAQAALPAASCFTRTCVTLFTDDTEMLSQELRLTNSIGPGLDWMLGVNWQDRETEFAFIADGRTNNNLATLSPTANSASVAIEGDTQIGVFGSLSWQATERLTIDAAARWGQSEKDARAYNVRRGAGPVFCPYLDPIHGDLSVSPTCVASLITFDETFENTSPSASVKYSLSDTWNIFASAARGYRSGGFNGTAVAFPGVVPETFEPESTTAYEIGTKFTFGGGLVTLTGFWNDFEGLLVSLPIAGDTAGRSYRDNAGNAETHGVDAEWAGRAAFFPSALGSLDFTLAGNWLTGEIQSGPYRGRTVEGSPEYTYTATGIYSRKLSDAWRFVGSASYRGQRGGFTNTTQINNLVPLVDLDLWDARLSLERGIVSFSVSAENLFDETYVALRDPNRSVYGDGREITFRIAVRNGSEAPRRR